MDTCTYDLKSLFASNPCVKLNVVWLNQTGRVKGFILSKLYNLVLFLTFEQGKKMFLNPPKTVSGERLLFNVLMSCAW